MAVKPVPEGYPRVTPYMIVDGAADAIDFYTDVFGATERMRMDSPDGRIGHAELQLGDSVIMLADEFPEIGAQSPKRVGGTPVTLTIYVDKVDDVVAKAVKKGAKELQPVENKFYGDRSGSLEDPFGHQWHFATHVEDVPPDEMAKRAEAFMKKQAG